MKLITLLFVLLSTLTQAQVETPSYETNIDTTSLHSNNISASHEIDKVRNVFNKDRANDTINNRQVQYGGQMLRDKATRAPTSTSAPSSFTNDDVKDWDYKQN